MKIINLTNNKGVVLVDDEDYEKLNSTKWYLHKNKTRSYARGGNYQKLNYMHRLILNVPKGLDIDHIDGNGLNNQKLNIRICSRSQNLANIRVVRSKSGFKGVIYVKDKKKWRACIQINYKVKNIGYFNTKEEASKAYDKEAKKLFGEFSRSNRRIKNE